MTRNHPVLDDMLKLGCHTQTKVAIAFQVYLNLSEAHTLWDIDYKYNEELNIIYLTGRKSRSAPIEIYIPMSSKSDITVTQLEALQNHLSQAVTLAIKDTDSTVVLYRIEKGLVPPETHEETKRKKQLKDSRFNVDSELRQNKEDIYMKAQGKDVQTEETNDNESLTEELNEEEDVAEL